MSKTKNFKQMLAAADVDGIIQWYQQVFVNKYYDVYSAKFDVKGLGYQENHFLKTQLWDSGSVWIRSNKLTGEPVLTQYTGANYNLYNFPTQVNLINKHNAPLSVVPNTRQTVDVDGSILWLRPNHKGLADDVLYYIGKMAEAETCITINLALQRTPWLLASDGTNTSKLKDIVRRILNNELVVYTDIDKMDLANISLNSPFIVDKIAAYEERLENKLKTLLGVDNQGGFINSQQQNLDTTNSNNDEITRSDDSMESTLRDGIERANKVNGLHLVLDYHKIDIEQIGHPGNFGRKYNVEGGRDHDNDVLDSKRDN